MLFPEVCPRATCPNHVNPPSNWFHRCGTYQTHAHGTVQRFQCKDCGKTCSAQTESLHYYAKRRAPLRGIRECLTGGETMREIARRYHLSTTAIANAVIRLGRQAMAGHLLMLDHLEPRTEVVVDGLRSFVTSQDFPCDLTTTVDREGEVILSMVHSVFRRGGTKTEAQQKRIEKKYSVWCPARGSMKRDLSLLMRELWDYLRPSVEKTATIDTDEYPLYATVLSENPIAEYFRNVGLLTHRTTPSTAARTPANPLFPVNYVDLLVRHRVREHFRETIAFGRNAVAQMHRMWLFAFDHNCNREYRARQQDSGVHAEQGTVDPAVIEKLRKGFFTRRFKLTGIAVPDSIRKVWTGTIPTPPHRWRKGQTGTDVRIPGFALRDLAG